MPAQKITDGVFRIGGENLTYGGDCLTYLVAGPPLVLIDAGASLAIDRLLDNIVDAGYDARDTAWCLLTHGHVDHIGGAAALRAQTGCRVAAHAGDAEAIATGDPLLTAANWYGVTLPELPLDAVLTGDTGEVAGLRWVHIPGHTPGSIAFYLDTPAGRVLFAQDVHGPFDAQFRSDIDQWRDSMETLLALEADILCEGHYGVYHGRDKAARFIRQQLAAHE